MNISGDAVERARKSVHLAIAIGANQRCQSEFLAEFPSKNCDPWRRENGLWRPDVVKKDCISKRLPDVILKRSEGNGFHIRAHGTDVL
jgi:hypothetical protein